MKNHVKNLRTRFFTISPTKAKETSDKIFNKKCIKWLIHKLFKKKLDKIIQEESFNLAAFLHMWYKQQPTEINKKSSFDLNSILSYALI